MKKIIQLLLILVLVFGLAACGEKEPPHEHSFSSEYLCDETNHWKKCECGEIGTKEEHKFSEWKYVTEDESGKYEERECSECGYIDTKVTTCEHDYQLITVPSTCVEEGHITSKCSKCDYVNNDNVLPLEDHTFGSWIVTKEPTCSESGEKYRICEVCDLKEEGIIDPLEHEYSEDYKYDLQQHWKECVCGEKDKIANHDFTDWTVLSEDENGTKEERACKVCKYSETRIEGCEHNYVTTTEESTCVKKGFVKEECSKCGDVTKYSELPLKDHKYSEWSTTKEATCSEEGQKLRKCSGCQKEETQILQKIKHEYSNEYKFNETNHWKECKCGAKSENAPHNFTSWTIVSEDQNGKKEERSCQTCNYKETKVSDCEHNYVTSSQESTCTVKGYEKSICSKCGHVNSSKELPLAEHTYGEWTVSKESTCKEEGQKERTCTVCSNKESDKLPKSNHDNEVSITKKPTCTEEGTATTKCKVCGESKEDKISKLSHAFGEWTVTKKSTCNDPGTREHTCLVCNYKESAPGELSYHAFGEWEVTKHATLEEEGQMTITCEVCGAQEHSPIDKLVGYTITVSGGTVNKKGENKDQSTIYVAEGEVVVITAKNYTGYTFYQWYSDGSEIIPISTFELYVTRSAFFYICFEEELTYGDWTLEKQPTCTEPGYYTRTERVTGLKQYMILYSKGHEFDYDNLVTDKEPTCIEPGSESYVCLVCGEKETTEISPLGHDFSGSYVIVEEAYGSKIGVKERSCTRCDAKETKNYIKAAYPDGNIKVTFDWDHRSYTSTTDRNEIHWMLDGNKYCFYINRDSDSKTHFYFYYEDKGPHSPVYVQKLVGNYPYTNGYGSYGWGIVGYVDSYDEFIEYIDSEAKGSDNGRNNSGLHTVYTMWEDIFNAAGKIPDSYYCSAVVEYYGYTCRIYENDGFAYYVTEDNCCLYFSGKGYNRDFAYVERIEEITEIPCGPVDYNSIYYIMIDIENGKDYSFKDGFYFNVENLYNKVEIYESEYISDRKVVKGFEVKDHSGNWVKITELAKNGSSWTTDSSFSYKDIINNYLQGKYPDCLEIRAILEDAELPVKVKVTNGYINIGYNDYGSESDCLANETIVLMPKYDEDKYNIKLWKVTVNGVTTEYTDDYIYSQEITLPESGIVLAECVLEEKTNQKENVTINVIGNGKVNKSTGEYSVLDDFILIATPNSRNEFVGWFVQGIQFSYGEGDGDMPMYGDYEDYYQYGEFCSNKPIYEFYLETAYDEIIITAVFRSIDATKDYIDVIVENGFLSTYSMKSLHVSAIRITSPNYYDLHGDYIKDIDGWELVEQTEEGPSTTILEGEYNGYYFQYDSTVKATIAN